MNNFANQVPFLRTSREFPEEIHQLAVEINKSYIDTSNAVNNRIISLFPSNVPAITGESWFITNQRQQTLRKMFTFTTTAALAHGIQNFTTIAYFTRMWGQFTDGTNWYGLIAGSNIAIAGQISFYVDPTNINFLVGAGAPALTKGILVLEWMSQI
jgi:hypothetical protein